MNPYPFFADVGGGSVENGTRHSLARIPLRWMIRQCFLLETGILFHREMFKNIGLDPATLYPIVKPRPPPVSTIASTAAATPRHSVLPSASTTRTLFEGGEYCDFVNEEEEDLADALSPVYDQLKLARYWWILEVLPQTLRFQNDDDTWSRTLQCVA